MVKRLIAVMLMAMLIVAVAFAGGVAEADEPDYTDPNVVNALIDDLEEADDAEQAFLALSLAAQEAVVDAVVNNVETVIEVVPPKGPSGAGGGASSASGSSGEECDHYETHITYYATSGRRLKLFKYSTSTHWCWDGTVITSDPLFVTNVRLYGIGRIFWYFVEDRTTSDLGGRGEWEYTDYAVGHFRLSIPVGTEIEVIRGMTISDDFKADWHPSIWKYQYADGTSSYRIDPDGLRSRGGLSQMNVGVIRELALVTLLNISAIIAGVIIVMRRQERQIFQVFGLAVIVLHGLHLLYWVMLLLILFAVIPSGFESGASSVMPEYISTPIASP